MNAKGATYLMQLTPAGRSAVATLRVEGPGATEQLALHFRSASGLELADQPVSKILFGRWGSDEGEALVVVRRAADAWEIHCHGGPAAVEAIGSHLIAAGVEPRSWREWVEQRDHDPIRAAALIALAAARTERTALILLDQYQGALRRAIERVQTQIAAEEEVAARRTLETLLRCAPLGQHLTRPWRVVLAGRPNVGKSSLINALVGYRRAIVYDQPGTTRDVVTATTAIDGWPVELADTAGLRDTSEAIETAGIEQTRAGLSSADRVVLVFDAAQAWSGDDAALAAAWPAALPVHNKADLANGGDRARPGGIMTSAITGEGVDELIAAIGRQLVPEAIPAGAAVPFTEAQQAALEEAHAALVAGHPAAAHEVLRRLLGESRGTRS